jgi:hypothetical protein
MMHTAEKWLQEGRQIRAKEQPCSFKKATSHSRNSSNTKSKRSTSKLAVDEPHGVDSNIVLASSN